MAWDWLAGDTSAENWDGPFDNHKRWCHHWCCAVNVFHVQNGTEELPNCLVEEVRKLCPKRPTQAHVGHKGRNQRIGN